MNDFFQRLNDSNWKGSICEVGMGIPFQSQFLSQPGASSTILFTHSPYHRDMQLARRVRLTELETKGSPPVYSGYRAVSAEMAVGLAERDLLTKPIILLGAPESRRFAIAVTASHKNAGERGESHGWVAVVTCDGNYPSRDKFVRHLFHFNLKKEYYINVGDQSKKRVVNRGYAGAVYAYILKWFLDKVLLNSWETWAEAIENMPSTSGNVISIDVINSPELTVEDHLLLASENNPLVFRAGNFRRVADYLRKYKRIIRGSFNPPTKYHEALCEDAMFEIDISNARKGKVSLEDLAHRISMVGLTEKPVMINCGYPLFADLHRSLRERGLQDLEYVVGSDTFNDIANPKYIPYEGFLEPLYHGGSGKLLVANRGGLVENEFSAKLNHQMLDVELPGDAYSSTKVREGDLSLVSDNIAEYIKENNLYGF